MSGLQECYFDFQLFAIGMRCAEKGSMEEVRSEAVAFVASRQAKSSGPLVKLYSPRRQLFVPAGTSTDSSAHNTDQIPSITLCRNTLWPNHAPLDETVRPLLLSRSYRVYKPDIKEKDSVQRHSVNHPLQHVYPGCRACRNCLSWRGRLKS